MGEYTIEIDGLVAKYGERTILHGVDLRVRPGEVRVILGGSGSGKSTLLKHIIGLVRPAGGQVRLLGVDLAAADEPERDAVLGRIGMLFQGGALLNSMTLLENVELPLVERTTLPKDVIREMARMKLAMLGLERATHLFPPELSGGMKKRAALARAMALDPAVLFCDEPSAGLDPITAAALDETLLGLRDQFGMSVVVVTHELASVEMISDKVLMLYKGEVLADGPLPEVKRTDHPMVRAFFERHEEAEVAGHGSVWQAMGEGRPA